MMEWSSGDMTLTALEGGVLSHAWEVVLAAIEEFADTAPALAMGLAAVLVVPAVALAALITRALIRRGAHVQVRRSARKAAGAQPSNTSPPSASCRSALLCVAGRPAARLTSEHPVIRIGRQEDNDIRFAAGTVHRYHAIIQRTPEAEYWVTDLSGPGGHGVAINGERVARGRLAPGDAIRLGEAEVIFRADA